jgi:hypothetical protein
MHCLAPSTETHSCCRPYKRHHRPAPRRQVIQRNCPGRSTDKNAPRSTDSSAVHNAARSSRPLPSRINTHVLLRGSCCPTLHHRRHKVGRPMADAAINRGHLAPVMARDVAHFLKHGCSQNGWLLRRGGCHKCCHSLENCDHGDLTASRFDSPRKKPPVLLSCWTTRAQRSSCAEISASCCRGGHIDGSAGCPGRFHSVIS